jgi:peptidyl-prolyl cis-trans isomerase D
MLLAIRDRAKGWLAWVIIVLIAIPFAFFGVYSYLTGGGTPNVAARVNDVEISVTQVNNAYRQQRQQLEQMFGDRLDPRMFDDRQLRLNAVEELIRETLLTEYVRSRGFRISDSQLAAIIRGQEAFHVDGRFSADRYRQLLSANMMSPEMYEARVRRGQALEQLQGAVFGSAMVTDADVDRLIRIERQQREFAYLTVSLKAFNRPEAVSEEKVVAFYEANPALFQRPEEVRLEYVVLDEAALRQQVDVSEEDVQQRYRELRASRFSQPGEREVRHILLELPDGASREQVQEVRQRLSEMREQIRAGELEFEGVAREHSDDPGSAAQGGDLGVIERGMMVETFEEAAFTLNEGEISQPVRTPFGLHLIQATRVDPPKVQPFETVRDQLREEMVAERVGNRMYEMVEKLGNLSYETPDSLEPAAEALGLEIRRTDWFSRNGAEDGVAADPRVVEAAFSQEVLGQNYNSEPLNLGKQHAVVRVAEHRPAARLPLDEVADQVRARVAREQAAQRAQELAAELRAKAAEGADLAGLAEQQAVSLTEVEASTRDAAEHPRAVVERAFALARPREGAVSVGEARLQNGDIAVIRLQQVADGDPAAMDAEERQQYRLALQQTYGDAAIQNLIASLRADAKVVVYENRL